MLWYVDIALARMIGLADGPERLRSGVGGAEGDPARLGCGGDRRQGDPFAGLPPFMRVVVSTYRGARDPCEITTVRGSPRHRRPVAGSFGPVGGRRQDVAPPAVLRIP